MKMTMIMVMMMMMMIMAIMALITCIKKIENGCPNREMGENTKGRKRR